MSLIAEHDAGSAAEPDPRGALLDEWIDLGAQIATLEARRSAVLAERANLLTHETSAEVRYSSLAQRSMVAEFAAAGHVSPVTMDRLFSTASLLAHGLPATWQALRAGSISRRHADVIVEAAPLGQVDDADDGATLRAAYERDVLPCAISTTPARTRAHALAVVAALRPATQEQLHREARVEREVSVRPTADGMAQLIAVIPEVLALGIHDRLTAMAADRAGTAESDSDGRTIGQRRADVLCDLLLSAAPSTMQGSDLESFRPTVHVTIAASTLIGRDDRMAELDHAGPLHPDIARRLAGHAPSFTRLFLDPSGMVSEVDTYVPSSRMKRHLRARDRHCRFPGCRTKAARCDIDHNRDRAYGGATALENLAHFCASHHPLKHPDVDRRHRWSVRQEPEGTLVWTSPLGRRYVDEPQPRVMFV